MQNVFTDFEDERLARKTKNSDEVEFVKQVLQYPRDRLARRTKNNNEVEFFKQVPQHLRERLACRFKNRDEVEFVKQVLQDPWIDLLANEKIVDKFRNINAIN